MKGVFCRVLVCPLLLLSSLIAHAHNVVGGVYVNGVDIEGEAGFSNGTMANAGTKVKITDQSGTPLGEVETDDQGFFMFTAKKKITYLFEINMGAGHILKMQLPADELPDDLDSGAATTNTNSGTNKSSTLVSNVAKGDNSPINTLHLEKAIAKQIIPLRKEIQALKEKSGLRDILGGIGYIFGLLGVVALIRERRLKANK
jgi:nickel transport protein